MIRPTKKAMFISAPFLSAMLATTQCKADSPSYIPPTAYEFCNLRAAHVSRLLWGSLISHQNDEFAHTYPLVDRSTLEEWRSGRWSCRNCSYVQMVSGNRSGSRSLSTAKKQEGTPGTRREDFNLWTQRPSTLPDRGR